MNLLCEQVEKILHLRLQKIHGHLIEYLEDQVHDQLLQLLHDFVQLQSELILDEVLDFLEVCVELYDLDQVMVEVLDFEYYLWHQV
jgi:hypothetical protein